MDHRGAPCLGNDGSWHCHHSTKRRPLQATDRSQTEACRSAYDSRAPHLTLCLGRARSHPPVPSLHGAYLSLRGCLETKPLYEKRLCHIKGKAKNGQEHSVILTPFEVAVDG